VVEAYGQAGLGTVFAMSPRGRKVGGIDDPIWGGEPTAEESGDHPARASVASGASGATVASGAGGKSGSAGGPPRSGSGQGNSKVAARGSSRAPRETPTKPDRPVPRGQQDRGGSGDGDGSGIAQDIPRRILVDDPGTARSDERECEVEGWFQTDDGLPVSSAFRPLSVACARPWDHRGQHRSKPRRARFRSGRVWVYEWRNAEASEES
jgi:hypothetical protein